MIVTRFEGSWERSSNGCDIYVDKEVMPFCVDTNIRYNNLCRCYTLYMELIKKNVGL